MLSRGTYRNAEYVNSDLSDAWLVEMDRWYAELRENFVEFAHEVAQAKRIEPPNEELAKLYCKAGEVMVELDEIVHKEKKNG